MDSYKEICERLGAGLSAMEGMRLKRETVTEKAINILTFVPGNDGLDLANALALREFLKEAENTGTELRDTIPALVRDLDLISVYFKQEEVVQERRGLIARIFRQRDAKSTVTQQVSNPINPQEAFERARTCNQAIMSEVDNLWNFIEELQDRLTDALIEPKSKVIDIVRTISNAERDSEEMRRLGAQRLYLEEAIALSHKHLVEMSLIKREFAPVVKQLRQNEENASKVEDDIVNVRSAEDIEKLTGRPIDAYQL